MQITTAERLVAVDCCATLLCRSPRQSTDSFRTFGREKETRRRKNIFTTSNKNPRWNRAYLLTHVTGEQNAKGGGACNRHMMPVHINWCMATRMKKYISHTFVKAHSQCGTGESNSIAKRHCGTLTNYTGK